MSNKKTILNETQIRRFMKLADMTPLSEPFVKGSTYKLSEQMPDDMAAAEEEDPMAAMPGEAEEPMDDLGAPEEGPGAGGVDIESLVSAIADAIEQETGVEVSVEGDGGEEEPMDDLGGMEDMAAEEPMDSLGPPDGMEDEAMMEQKLRRYIRQQVAGLLAEQQDDEEVVEEDEDVQEEGHKHTAGGQDMLTKGTNSNRDFEKDDNRQNSAGEKHTGGGKGKVSKTHMGGNSAGLPLEESALERLTSRVAARLLDKRR